jgi:predicted NBD/HSP70 family sugar kinase
MRRLGIDVGGTFTDVVALDGEGNLQVEKTLSTPSEPAAAVVEGVHHLVRPRHDARYQRAAPGAADGEGAHSRDEFVLLEHNERRVRLLQELLLTLGG